ncbi:Hypothetical predicted protein [Cloeon dipterum]|uniref:Uncharacterized protein n=1 Tax=Cloeon dipterum TaxID=197152 RepID=A0A8S1DKM6_9INSE|nr:Hypothetical predicted protein [Cloeon dipterum]
MITSFCALFFLGLSSLATAANFTQVFEWPNGMDYEWPSEASRTQALNDGAFKPENIQARFMAVYGTRIFLSLENYDGIPASLVTFMTSSASFASPPKLNPFPSRGMQGKGFCNKIEQTKGMDVDSVGRLWVLDDGSENCNAKLWTIDLSNNDHTKLIHRFSFRFYMHDLVLDETPNGTFAYILRWGERNIIVFRLEGNESWIVQTPGSGVYSIALSPKSKEEPRKLYLGKWDSDELYSISVTALRKETRIANPKLIGKWNARPYKMLIDNHGTMYAAFWEKNYINSWNTSQPFEEQRFYEDAGLNTYWPFNFAFDQNGTLWMTVFDKTRKPKYRLLKTAVDARSFKASPE